MFESPLRYPVTLNRPFGRGPLRHPIATLAPVAVSAPRRQPRIDGFSPRDASGIRAAGELYQAKRAEWVTRHGQPRYGKVTGRPVIAELLAKVLGEYESLHMDTSALKTRRVSRPWSDIEASDTIRQLREELEFCKAVRAAGGLENYLRANATQATASTPKPTAATPAVAAPPTIHEVQAALLADFDQFKAAGDSGLLAAFVRENSRELQAALADRRARAVAHYQRLQADGNHRAAATFFADTLAAILNEK